MSKNPARTRLLTLVVPHWRVFTVAMLALAGGSGINLLLPEVLRRLLAPETIGVFTDKPYLVAGGIAALFAFQGICFYYRAYLFGIIGQKVVADLREKVFAAILAQPIQFFDKERVGELVSRLGSDTLMVQDAVSLKLSIFIRYTFQVVVGLVMMLWLSPKLSITIILVLPILVGLSIILGKRLRAMSKIQQAELARSTVVAEEAFSGIRLVKAFNRITHQLGRYHVSNAKTLQAGMERTWISAFFSSFVSFLMNLAIVGVMLFGIILVSKGGLSIGDLTAFLLYGVIVAVSFAFVAGGYGEFVQAVGSAERIFALMDLPRPREGGEKLPSELSTSGVTFKNFSFAYPIRHEVLALNAVNLTIAPGKRTALVGPSGSGKSTLVALLLGLYDPPARSLFIGETPFEEIERAALREKIGVVTQDAPLFATSIKENLLFGALNASDAALEDACKKVNLLDFIKALPQGFNTEVGERGVQLSGGQRQRLAIARAMLRSPELLILDEATSALDSENERIVQNALEELMKGRTSLIIAHRLSTIKDADKVYVLENGQIVQEGTHESLSKTSGLYQQLVSKQELAA